MVKAVWLGIGLAVGLLGAHRYRSGALAVIFCLLGAGSYIYPERIHAD